MSFLGLFRRRREDGSASVAKERLQLILAHERAGREDPDFLPRLQKDLLSVISKYVPIQDDCLNVSVQRTSHAAVLEINIELPPRG
jgi:cell division topological specificity factor